jgi:hypothetical protein
MRLRCPHCQRTFKAPTTQQAKAGRARANALTPERRAEIAKKAADARWHRQS